ncbi:MAG TPA: RNB domain-containing ribonuclease [Burkholderiales bacterium]|nr:RNB domain-containing ribonuclease [Burkholderiales bacterium]
MAELQASISSKLIDRTLPEEFPLQRLLYDPDKNSIEYKALLSACEQTGLSVPALLEECGAIPSSCDYHLDRFFYENFPKGLPVLESCDISSPELPFGSARAFSIDDAATTEIDDAFSVSSLPNGNRSIGIHIAVPSTGIPKGSDADLHALKMLSTIYIPGQKFTMLPQKGIDVFTLSEKTIFPLPRNQSRFRGAFDQERARID